MVRSPFTFYRASALTMASDLASRPATGIYVQCCGDAHVCNFGGFATPERRIIFSINDLDETLPADWEWDLKRLAASFIVACRDNSLSDSAGKDVVENCVRGYRESMAEFSQMKTLELWYHAIWAEDLIAGISPGFSARNKPTLPWCGRCRREDTWSKRTSFSFSPMNAKPALGCSKSFPASSIFLPTGSA